MEPLRKALKDYFIHLEKHSNIVNDLVTRTVKPVEVLRNFSEQLSYVKRAVVEDLPIGKIPNIKENLLFKIQCCIEEEIVSLEQIVEECRTANTELEKRLQSIHRCLENVGDLRTLEDQQSICFGSASNPSILQMIEWAQDSWRHFHVLYIKLSSYVMTYDMGEENKINIMKKHNLESEELKALLERALASTHRFVKGS